MALHISVTSLFVVTHTHT